MFKKSRFFKYVFLLSCFLMTSAYVSAQDLGSSSGIFRTSNPKSKTNKPADKPKSTPRKKSSPTRKTPARSTARKTSRTADVTKTAKKTTPINDTSNKTVVIEYGADDSDQNSNKAIADNNKAENEKMKADVVITIGDAANSNFNESFEKAIDEGNNYRNNRNYQKAEAAYLRAQSLQEKDSRAVYGLGNLYSDQNRWEESEIAYRTAISLEPSSPEAYVALSFVLTRPIVGTNSSERYAEAETAARNALKLEPANAVAFDQLGVALELRGLINSPETINAYRKAIKLDSNFALAYAHLGRLLRRQGKVKESSEAYRQAIKFSTDVPTKILVADVMQSQQRYMESEELLRAALKQDPKNPTALFLLGRALTTRGSFDEAEKILKKSASVSPNSFVSYMLLGSMFTRRGEFGEAEKYLDKAAKMVSLNEKKILALDFENVGDGLLSAGKPNDAGRVYKKALELYPDKISLTEKLGKTQNN